MSSIKVPPLGESIVEATVARWLKNEGDAVAPGDSLVELETDKISVDVPAMSSGVLKKRLKTEGDVVHVDEVLAEIEDGATAAAGTAATPKPDAAKGTDAGNQPAPAPQAANAGRVSPAAGRLAADR